jgi:integrase
MTVSSLIDEVLTRSTDRLTERTIFTYRERARIMIHPHLGNVRLIDLTAIDLQRWVDRLRGIGYMPTTIHSAVAVMQTALREATTLDLLDRNFAEGIRLPSIEHSPAQAWTLDECARFLAEVASDEIYGALSYVALVTGTRPGELRALKWDMVFLDDVDRDGRPQRSRSATRGRRTSKGATSSSIAPSARTSAGALPSR